MIKSVRVKWTGHVPCTGEMINEYTIWFEYLKNRDHTEEDKAKN
jgi:hypothetical protein